MGLSGKGESVCDCLSSTQVELTPMQFLQHMNPELCKYIPDHVVEHVSLPVWHHPVLSPFKFYPKFAFGLFISDQDHHPHTNSPSSNFP